MRCRHGQSGRIGITIRDMERFRAGRDMTILWSINDRNGAALPLDDKDVHLFYTCERGRYEADIEISNGNVVAWSFLGKDQRTLGTYALTIEVFQSNGKRTIRKDICEAFALVGKDCLEKTEEGEADIREGGELVLTSELDIYRISPIIPYIGANGNWFIDGVDTGKRGTVDTPSGDPLHDMYVACGAVWNGSTGYWELNGLTDITNEQMRTIYICTKDYNLEGAPTIFEYAYTLMRTNLFPLEQHSLFKMLPAARAFNAGSMFYVCSNLEVLRLCTPRDDISFGFPVLDASALFYGCKKLKTIIGNIVMRDATILQDMFGQCFELENVQVTMLRKSISFDNSPKLSNASILSMVNNSAAASAIAITLHPEAYARAVADAEILSSLETHPYVSLASA